jgi:hypothetical protein
MIFRPARFEMFSGSGIGENVVEPRTSLGALVTAK